MNSFAWGCLMWCMPAVMPAQVTEADCLRFPPPEICFARALELNAFARWLADQRNESHDWPWSEFRTREDYWPENEFSRAVDNQIQWALKAGAAWENLGGAGRDYRSSEGFYTRNYLAGARNYLGKERYIAGVCPPEAPLWWRLRR